MGKTIIGIDPGKSGGIAYSNHLFSDMILINVYDMPTTELDMINLFKEMINKGKNNCVAYIELQHGFPNTSSGAMFNFGKHYGTIMTALAANNIRTIEVSSQRWTKTMGLGTMTACNNKTEWKNKLKAKAQHLFPNVNVTLWNADALLILEYGIQQETLKKENINKLKDL